MTQQLILPVLVLVAWSLIMWIWLYATRIPAMTKIGKNPNVYADKTSDNHTLIPFKVRQVADNYNHLMEQPTIFYAMVIGIALIGTATQIDVYLAWAYVILRVMHSIWQSTKNTVMPRFYLFIASTLVLFVLTIRAILHFI